MGNKMQYFNMQTPDLYTALYKWSIKKKKKKKRAV